MFNSKFQSVNCIEFVELQNAKNGSLSKPRKETIKPEYLIIFEALLSTRQDLTPVTIDLIS